MKTGRAKSAVVKDAQAPKYILDSYEYRLLNWLGSLDEFLKSREIPYAVFGGSAVAGYVGHLPRKLHDIDLIVHPSNSGELCEFLVQNGHELQETHKSSK